MLDFLDQSAVSAKGRMMFRAEIRQMDQVKPGQAFGIERLDCGDYRLKQVEEMQFAAWLSSHEPKPVLEHDRRHGADPRLHGRTPECPGIHPGRGEGGDSVRVNQEPPLPHVMIPHHPPDVLAIAEEHQDVIGLKDPVGQRDAEDLADRLAGGAESGGAAALGDGDQIEVVL